MAARRKSSQQTRRAGSGKKFRRRSVRTETSTSSNASSSPNTRKRGRGRASGADLPANESRQVEALTVAWMLVVLSGLMSELLATSGLAWHWLAGRSAVAPSDGSSEVAGATDFVGLIAIVGVFAAIALCPLNLLLTMLVRRLRREPPPRSLVTLALVIALIPIPLWIVARIHFGG